MCHKRLTLDDESDSCMPLVPTILFLGLYPNKTTMKRTISPKHKDTCARGVIYYTKNLSSINRGFLSTEILWNYKKIPLLFYRVCNRYRYGHGETERERDRKRESSCLRIYKMSPVTFPELCASRLTVVRPGKEGIFLSFIFQHCWMLSKEKTTS